MWARACTYGFRAVKGMENFTHSRLPVEALLAPLLAPGQGGGVLVMLQDECEQHTQPSLAS